MREALYHVIDFHLKAVPKHSKKLFRDIQVTCELSMKLLPVVLESLKGCPLAYHASPFSSYSWIM